MASTDSISASAGASPNKVEKRAAHSAVIDELLGNCPFPNRD
jgi:hypothetical protein